MIHKLPTNDINILKSIQLNGHKLLLLDYMDNRLKDFKLEEARNIFLIDSNGAIVWRVSSKNDRYGDPFTNIYWKNGRLKAYRWDGGEYAIDERTGVATPETFLK